MQLFKKPDLQKTEREAYLKELESQILRKEQELVLMNRSADETKRTLDETLAVSSVAIRKQIEEIDNVLKLKQAERRELEKPIGDRMKSLDERAISLDLRAKAIDEKEQQVFERERGTETKLESLKDLSDDLGETRTRLLIKEKLVLGREGILKNRETQYLLAVEDHSAKERKFYELVQEREYAISLRELNLQSKEENLAKREKELLNGHILLNDQRGVLARAWGELEKKKKHHV